MEFLAPFFLWFKALHVISVIAWMAGLFYLPRLFVRHAENIEKQDVNELFKVMEAKLYRIIMNPAMMASWLFALLMLATGLVDVVSLWFAVKFVAVLAMTWFHFWCKKYVAIFANHQNTKPSRYFRMMNEVPTLLMIAIVIMAIVKPFG